MTDLTLEQVDRAIAKGREEGIETDELALLWITRAQLQGIDPTADHLRLLMSVGAEEAEDIVARLSEKGFIDHA